MFSPFSQFEIIPLFFNGYITNYSIYLVLVFLTIIFLFSSIENKLIPTNFTAALEIFYSFILNVIIEQTTRANKYFPILFTLFFFILTGNLLGLMPFGFTITSHIALTLLLA
jgi:F-type H+-transporting ATPase subunit a